jgi:hypothetical protein
MHVFPAAFWSIEMLLHHFIGAVVIFFTFVCQSGLHNGAYISISIAVLSANVLLCHRTKVAFLGEPTTFSISLHVYFS